MTTLLCAPQTSPRSSLHALQPLGAGTEQAESLLSYFCRLAQSHCISSLDLSRSLMTSLGQQLSPKYAWYDRQISGLGDAALQYTEALAATTSRVDLQLHTFLPWRQVIAEKGLPLHKTGQFCVHCLYEDWHRGATPYLRLCWEPTVVSVCHHHHKPLLRACPHCHHPQARHNAAFTIVGWCGKCDRFMGIAPDANTEEEIDPLALWQAQQIALLVQQQQRGALELDRGSVIQGVQQVIEQWCSGTYAALARQVGIPKSTIHAWLRDARTPTADISLRIAHFAGIDLAQLLSGQVQRCQYNPESAPSQFPLPLDYPPRPHRTRRVHRHDWADIAQQLEEILRQPMPVSLMHAASVVGIPSRMLYMQCNTTVRKITQRWLAYLKRRKNAKVVEAWPTLEAACRQLLAQGIAPNLRTIQELVPAQLLNRIHGLWDVLRDVCEHIESSNHATSNLSRKFRPARYLPAADSAD